jgi:hypothetical protein
MSATRATWPSIVEARCLGGAEDVDDPQALFVVVEPGRAERLQHALAGVSERRVAEVVPKGDRLGQLFVQPQHFGDGAGDLRHLEGVRQPGAVVIPGRREEHLGLVFEPAERFGVDDAIAIALEGRPDRVFVLGTQPPLGEGAARRLWGQGGSFPLFELVANRHDGGRRRRRSHGSSGAGSDMERPFVNA